MVAKKVERVVGVDVKDYLKKYLNENLKEKVLLMYDAIQEDFSHWPASIKYHHNYEGGLYKHTQEVIESGLKLYKTFEEDFKKKLITESDIVFVCFIHDLEKLTKYNDNKKFDSENWQANVYEFEFNNNKLDCHDSAKVVNICAKYGIFLSDKQLNAVSYHHGGWTKDGGKMHALAVLLHMSDLMSANVKS
jgi:hypothetical protein